MSTLWLLLYIDRTRNRHCFAFSPYLHFSSLQTSCMKCFFYRARSFLSGSFTALAMTLQAWNYKHFFSYFSCAILLKAEIHDMHLSWFKSHVYWYLITLTIDVSATPHMPHGQKSVFLLYTEMAEAKTKSSMQGLKVRLFCICLQLVSELFLCFWLAQQCIQAC